MAATDNKRFNKITDKTMFDIRQAGGPLDLHTDDVLALIEVARRQRVNTLDDDNRRKRQVAALERCLREKRHDWFWSAQSATGKAVT